MQFETIGSQHEEATMKQIIFAAAAITCIGAVSAQPMNCPAENFGDFAVAFMNDASTQKQWTSDFVEITSMEQADVRATEDKKSMKFPLIQSFQELTTAPSAVQIGSWDAGNFTIAIRINDDMIQTYTFKRKGKCWALTEIMRK